MDCVGFDHVIGMLHGDPLAWLVGGLSIQRIEQVEPTELASLVQAGEVTLLGVRTRGGV